MCFGASSGQSQAQGSDFALSNTIQQELQNVFGADSRVVNSLFANLRPIVRAGAGQQGFSPAEQQALDTQARLGTGNAYNKAAQAVGNEVTSATGGNLIPSGAVNNVMGNLAGQAANTESNLLNQNIVQNYDAGRSNFFNAAHLLGGSTSAFDNLSGIQNAGNNANQNAGNMANTIASQGHSWLGALTGIAGSVLGGLTGGLMGGGGWQDTSNTPLSGSALAAQGYGNTVSNNPAGNAIMNTNNYVPTVLG